MSRPRKRTEAPARRTRKSVEPEAPADEQQTETTPVRAGGHVLTERGWQIEKR